MKFFEMLFTYLIISILSATRVLTKDNDLALTPPMGWISWARYRCEIDCKTYPDSCINEALFKAVADRMANDGYKEVGFQYVNIDDCWSEMKRDSDHRLVADKQRFPNGIKALADYVHSKGLKFGIYGDVGTKTCDGYPGQYGQNGSNYFKIDAQTFAEWGVDSFKFDGCYQDAHKLDKLYPEMGQALNETGRKILYSCEWPLHQIVHGIPNPDYDAIVKTCNTFRNYNDILASWQSIQGIIDFYGQHNDLFIKYSGPGHFADPDMIVVGDFGVSYAQSKTQISMWAMFSAPLMMSNDLRDLKPEFKALLLNKDVIAVDQDKHGIMAKRVFQDKYRQAWVKKVEPVVKGVWSHAVIYIYSHGLGDRKFISLKVSDLIPNLNASTEFVVHDLWKEEEGKDIIGTVKSTDHLVLKVTPSGGSRMIKLIPK